MRRAKGFRAIAAHIGVHRETARELIRNGVVPVTVEGGAQVADVAHLDNYRRDRAAIPAWENEGGAQRTTGKSGNSIQAYTE